MQMAKGGSISTRSSAGARGGGRVVVVKCMLGRPTVHFRTPTVCETTDSSWGGGLECESAQWHEEEATAG